MRQAVSEQGHTEPRVKMPIGTVKWWNEVKGFGFITSEGTDVFVNNSGILPGAVGTLEEGQMVEFELVQLAQGPGAVKVRPAWETPASRQEALASRGIDASQAAATPSPTTDAAPLASGQIWVSDLADCVGCVIHAIDVVDNVLDEIIKMESGERYRIVDGTSPLVDEFDDVIILRDKDAGLYKIVTPYEVLEAKRLKPRGY
jgi:CspA family cold shock protein